MRRWTAWLSAGLLISGASRAWAQVHRDHFGEAGQLAISGDRLFGYVHSSVTASAGEQSLTNKNHSLTLLSSAGSLSSYGAVRIAIDGFFARGASIGGAVGYSFFSSGVEGESSTATEGFLLAPRLGYATMFGRNLGIWPRLGFTWMRSVNDDEDVQLTVIRYAVTMEAPLVIVPVSHMALLIGPTFDVGLRGSATTSIDSTEADVTATDIGFQFGLGGYFSLTGGEEAARQRSPRDPPPERNLERRAPRRLRPRR